MTVYQTNGIWRYRFQIKGQRYFASLPHCKTKTQARAAEDEAKTKARRGELQTPAERTTLADFVKGQFVPWSKARHSPRWHREVSYQLPRILDALGGKTFAAITTADCENVLLTFKHSKTKTDKPPAPATINRLRAVMSSIFARALKAEIITRNPVAVIDGEVEDNARTRILSDDEEARLFAVLEQRHRLIDAHLLPFCTLLLHTGMRFSEVATLRWSEVDFERRQIVRATSKSKRRRVIPLNSVALATLQGLPQAGEWVLPNPDTGKPFTHIKRGFASACKEAKVFDFTPHCFRHTFISRLIQRGADPAAVKDLAGHARLDMTARYTHADAEHKSNVVELLAYRQKPAAEDAAERKTA